ncbi:MAG: carboxypeptidase-like regulatory domain-containing protein [Gemmatimonadetes bacterium]|nr:carboxypeptidase-like regulatory domain-containing protein [Gemmatimonadota bacterium]
MQQPGLFRPTAFARAASRVAILVLGVFALLASTETAAFAQVTGKVIGTVTDRDTGQPLVGAQVVVEGTNLGNVTNEDGYYFINNTPVGVQEITAQYLGYQTQTQEQRVLAGQTDDRRLRAVFRGGAGRGDRGGDRARAAGGA